MTPRRRSSRTRAGCSRASGRCSALSATDMERPDWFYDPVTGRRSAPEAYAFSLDQRDESAVGNIKQVWEVNRLQHLTLLAVAWYLTEEDAYAERVAEQLRSWWRENPFLSGINWTSGIELGIRLINFAWIRRLLDGWPPVADLFERNDLALRQIRWHQEWLAAFESKGSSANNHVIAEAAGQLAASCAFPWFPESSRWRQEALRLLERELDHNTFPSGVNRELASDYHGFVAELGLFAALEASAAGVAGQCCHLEGCCARWRTRWPRSSTSGCGRRARGTRTRGAWCCSTRLSTTAGRRCSRSATRSSGGLTGGLLRHRTREACSRVRCLDQSSRSAIGPCAVLTGSRMPASQSSERTRLTLRRYGAAATAGRTASCPSPRTHTPTRCR